jgi:hypothetical protein
MPADFSFKNGLQLEKEAKLGEELIIMLDEKSIDEEILRHKEEAARN